MACHHVKAEALVDERAIELRRDKCAWSAKQSLRDRQENDVHENLRMGAGELALDMPRVEATIRRIETGIVRVDVRSRTATRHLA